MQRGGGVPATSVVPNISGSYLRVCMLAFVRFLASWIVLFDLFPFAIWRCVTSSYCNHIIHIYSTYLSYIIHHTWNASQPYANNNEAPLRVNAFTDVSPIKSERKGDICLSLSIKSSQVTNTSKWCPPSSWKYRYTPHTLKMLRNDRPTESPSNESSNRFLPQTLLVSIILPWPNSRVATWSLAVLVLWSSFFCTSLLPAEDPKAVQQQQWSLYSAGTVSWHTPALYE